MMSPSEDEIGDLAAEWFARLQDEAATDDERALCARWRATDPKHEAAWQEVQRLWSGLDQLAPSHTEAVPARPAGASGLAGPPFTAAAVGRRHRHRSLAAIAASVCVMVAAWAWLTLPSSAFRPWADYRTATAERRVVELPDGSVATLDADTALSLDFNDGVRSLRLLTGKAYFEVAHDAEHPFIVHAGAGSVRAVGTAFDVDCNGSAVGVAVSEGQVRVSLGDTPDVDLLPGQALHYGATMGDAESIALADVAAWRQGRLVFQNAPLAEVLAQLQRHRGGRIVVTDSELANRPVTGVFDVSDPDDALDTVTTLVPTRVVRPLGKLMLIMPAS